MDRLSPFFIGWFLIIWTILALPLFAFGSSTYTKMDIHLVMDVENQIVKGTAKYEVPPNTSCSIDITGLSIKDIEPKENSKMGNTIYIKTATSTQKGSITFSVALPSLQKALYAKDPTLSGSYLDKNGAALFTTCFPHFNGLGHYTLSAQIPEGWTAISESDKTYQIGQTWSFYFPYPREDITLIAGNYVKKAKFHKDIAIECFFFPEDVELTEQYLTKASRYLDLYAQMIGPYPFKRFAIVENRLPTGFGLSTFTLLGQQVARLPFIVDTSLGHEILHSWFGNSVYIGEGGNWSEGLTTYLADHLYAEEKGKGAEYRHNALVEYQSYIHDKAPFPLKEFTYRIDRPAKAVGYIKGFMFFHMFRQLLGDNDFYKGLRIFYKENRFKQVGFNELRLSFEKSSNQDLKWFFDQWLNRIDVPILEITSCSARPTNDNKWKIALSLKQAQDEFYKLKIPIAITTSQGVVYKTFSMDKKKGEAEWKIEHQPKTLKVDPSYDIMRHLDHREFPPVLHRLFGAKEKHIVITDKRVTPIFTNLMKQKGFVPRPPSIFEDENRAKGAYLIIGPLPSSLKHIASQIPSVNDKTVVKVVPNPFDPENVITVVLFSDVKELNLLATRLFHYGKYSTLMFKNGHIIKKQIDPYEHGITFQLFKETTWMAASDLSKFDLLASKIKDKKAIFVGEKHDEYSHHLTQKRIIQALFEAGVPVAVGMEMFQRPFQDALTKFINGEIDEDEMLRRSEYFKRWGYDYHLYSPILRYCRDHKIPIVALNLRSEISKKVARQGIQALTDEEKKLLPASIDWTKDEYKQVLREIYSLHGKSMSNFENFYQAQVLWDETMAQSISDYLKSHPHKQMVVLAGSGHILYRLGIPCRAERRNILPQAVIALSNDNYEANEEMADYFIFPGHIQAPFSAKLGVYLDETEKGLLVKKVSPGSPAEKGGIKENDIIVEFDSRKVPNITELKLALLKKDEGDYAIVKVRRSRKLLPDEEIELKIGPFKPIVMSPHLISPHKNLKTKKERR